MAVSFLHCNQRHHSLALADIGGVPRVLHCMVEMQTLDAVGYALDRMMKLGFPIYRLLGRHGNDRMVSFYVDGPGGLQMEVGWGGLLIDGAGWCVGRIAVPSAWGHHTMPLPQVLPGSTPA